jgi:hypothetical protein
MLPRLGAVEAQPAGRPGIGRESSLAGDDLALASGTRLLHIGPHKTGSSALQSALHLARENLATRGVIYPGRGRQTLFPILAVTGQPGLLGEPSPKIGHWDGLVKIVQDAGDQTVIVSSEFFSQATDAVVKRVVTDMGGPRVHVVATLRPLVRILPSQWQQYVQNGFRLSYAEWLTGILSQPPSTPTPGFWLRHRHDELIARWADEAGPENVTVVVVDESDRRMLLRTFEELLGLPDGILVPEDEAENRSLTAAEVEIVRLLNHEFKRRGWPDANYAKYMRYGAVRQMKAAHQPGPGEPRITTPDWARERAAEIGAEMAKNIAGLGVRVVGDLSTLGAVQADPPKGRAAAGLVVPAQAGSAAAETVTLLPAPATAGTTAAGSAVASVQPAPAGSAATPAAGAAGTASTGPAPEAAAGEAPASPAAGSAQAEPASGVILSQATADLVQAAGEGEKPKGWAFALAESPEDVSGVIPAEAAAQAIIGAFLAGGIAGRTLEESVAGISAKSLARVVAQRTRQRTRQKLRLRRH